DAVADERTPRDGEPLSSTNEDVVSEPLSSRADGAVSDAPATPGRTTTKIDETPVRAVDVPDDTPELVAKFLDEAGIQRQDRAALLEKIGKNDLAQAEVLDDFRQRATEITSKWDDISQLGRNADASQRQFDEALARYHEALLQNAPTGARQEALFGMHVSEARKLLQDDPQALRALDDYVRVRSANANIQLEYLQALSPRVGAMQKVLDDLAM